MRPIKGKLLRQTCLWMLSSVVNLFTPKERIEPVSTVPHVESGHEPIEESCPEFMRFFYISEDYGIGIERIDRLPDRTAIIRIVGQSDVSKPFRRKVLKDKRGDEYIKISDHKYYLKKK